MLPASELLLPWTLSAVHLALVLALLVLLPVVHRFQALRSDLMPTSGLPAAFFSLMYRPLDLPCSPMATQDLPGPPMRFHGHP